MGNLSALANNVVQSTPVGVIEAFAGVNSPAGWLFCDGSAISRIQYPELFSALGTTYGSGDGSTTFNLPDLRGRMPFGKGTHADVASLGQNEGASLANRRPKHQHTVYDPNHSHQQYLGWSGSGNVLPYWDGNTSRGIYGGGNTGPTSTGIKINPEGASSSSSPQDAPPYLVVNYIIKAVADLPRGGWFYQNQPPVVTQLPSNPQIGEEVYYYNTATSGYQRKRYNGNSWDTFSDTGSVAIDTSGRIKFPYQPRVMAYIGGSGVYTNSNPVIFANPQLNVGNHYNSSTGIFTCPVDGVYAVTAQGLFATGGNYAYLTIYRSGSGFADSHFNGLTGANASLNVFSLVPCSASQTITIGASGTTAGMWRAGNGFLNIEYLG